MIFNELEYAKKMLEKGFIQDKYTMELKILAKYYNKNLNLKTDNVKIKLKEFCLKYLPKYNEVLHLEMIIKATKYGVKTKNKLLIIPPIPITKKELNNIESLKDIKLETFSFVALVLGKIDKYKKLNGKEDNKKFIYYCNNLKEMFISSKIKCNKEQRENFIDLLSQTQLFDYTIFGTLKVNFIDESDNQFEFTINNYENFVLEYLKYKGENIQYCDVCGIPFSPTNNKSKYCYACAKDIKQEQDRIADKKYKLKIKSEKIEILAK